jgi:diguanylate cyclase (GGDEF)-like protein
MRAYASKLLGSPDVETLPPPAQWAVLEAAYEGIGASSVGNIVPLLLILALPLVTGAMWPFAWFIAALAAMAGGRFATARFKQIATGAPVAFHARRYTVAAAAQMAVLGAGGVGAAWNSHLEFCVLAALPIGFAMMNLCATARMARAAGLQVTLLGAPIVAACVVQSLRGHGAPPFAFLACMLSMWAAGAGLLAREVAARNHRFALAVLAGGRTATPAGAKPDITVSGTFQRLHGRDQVTGLLNGYSFAHLLAREAERAAVAELPISLLLLDWDGYESFAARRTPKETTAKLIDIAQRVRATLRRQSDEVARLGDGRFGVVLAGTDAFGANVVAQNLLAAMNRTPGDSPPGAVAVPVPLSIGIASYCGRGLLPETQLMEFASGALRYAKVNGGSQIRRHDEAAHAMRPASQKLAQPAPSYEKAAPGPLIDGTQDATTLALGHAFERAK